MQLPTPLKPKANTRFCAGKDNFASSSKYFPAESGMSQLIISRYNALLVKSLYVEDVEPTPPPPFPTHVIKH